MRFSKKFAQKSRKVFYFIHLWTGLLLGLWLVMMGLTGSILAWKSELVEWETRQRVSAPVPASSGKTIPVSKAIAALKAFNPDLTPERNLILPASNTGYYLHSARGEVNGERVTQIYLVHPVTAQVYAPVIGNTLWVEITEQLHHNLLLGVKGTVTNGFFTFFTLFMLISGAWLWWPSTLKQFQQRTLLKRGASIKRTLYDLHNILGVYLFGLLFLVTLTGVLICYNGQTDQSITKGINRLAGVPETPRPNRADANARRGQGSTPDIRQSNRRTAVLAEEQALASEGRRQPLPIDVMVEKARAALPNNSLVSIAAPRRPGQPFQASYEFVRITSGGVPFDPYTGERLNSGATAAFGRPPSPGTATMGAIFHLHYGWFAGNWSKVLYCISGFLPLGLFVTGIWLWLGKKQRQARNRRLAKLKKQNTATKPVTPVIDSIEEPVHEKTVDLVEA